MTTIGIIGGSGLYDMAELTGRTEQRVDTPFGEPSAPFVTGTLRGKPVAFLARHGETFRARRAPLARQLARAPAFVSATDASGSTTTTTIIVTVLDEDSLLLTNVLAT